MSDHDSVAGFQRSASNTGLVKSLNPGPLVPFVTRIEPSARMVALVCRRAKRIGDTSRQLGEP